MKVQFDKSNYIPQLEGAAVFSCSVDEEAHSHQSRTVNPCLFKCMYSSCTSYVCLMCLCVWVGGYMGLGGGGGGMSGGDLRPPSYVICI